MMKSSPVLLSENELRSALQPLLDRALAERLKLFQLQLEPRLVAMLDAATGAGGRAEAETGVRLGALLQAKDEEAICEALWQATGDLVGGRALIVQWKQELAVWRAEGTSLPARMPQAELERNLHQGRALAIKVRERVVGWLFWGGSKYDDPARIQAIELYLRAAGLALTECGLREQESSSKGLDPAKRPESLPVAGSPEARFAWLLLADLEGLLQRDRTQRWQSANGSGQKAEIFADEVERCRRAFGERFPDSAQVFEEAARDWAK